MGTLINGKSENLLKSKKNPRKLIWTILYRRKNKKGTMTEIDARKRKRRVTKINRGVGNLSWAEVQAKKAQRPEIRKAQREAAIEKEKQRKKEAAKKKEMLKSNQLRNNLLPKILEHKNQQIKVRGKWNLVD